MTRLTAGRLLLISMIGIARVASAADLGTGIKQYQLGQFGEAEKTLWNVVNAEPENMDANYYLGMTLIEEKKYHEAEPYLQKAAETKPEAKVELGRAYMMQNRLDEAMNILNSAEAQAENSKLYEYRGMIYLKQNHFPEAAQQLTKATELDPKNAYAHYYLGTAQSRLNRPDQMQKEFELFLQLAPDAPEAAKVKSLLSTTQGR